MEKDKLLIQFEENSRHFNAFGRTWKKLKLKLVNG
jgi:hypothetical protein